MSVVTIVGAGHVGVVYAAGFAELGHKVSVIDIDRARIASLRRGRTWFHEPGLPELLARGVRRQRIAFTTSYKVGLARAQFVLICVPTPISTGGSLDDSYLRQAFAQIRANAGHPAPIIVNKSTVPVGTGDAVSSVFAGDGVRVASNPEFLAEGRAVDDFFHPTRIVIGAHDHEVAEAVATLYATLKAPIVITDPVTAELSKLASNAFLATKISFANAISQIGDAIGADGEQLTHVLGLDPRIGAGHLKAGLGFGGSCLPKDLAAVEHLARSFAAAAELFSAVAAVNRQQPARVADHILARFGSLIDRRIALLGAAFKAGTDDIRESPGLALARQLVELHARVAIYDPVAGARVRSEKREGVVVTRSALAAARGADAVVIATEWPEFAALDLPAVRRAMRGNLIVDGRGVLEAGRARSLGFDVVTLVGSRHTNTPAAR